MAAWELINLLLVEDHEPTRRELILLLCREADLNVVGEAASGEDAIAMARALRPNVVLMDLALPGMSGVEATREIVAADPDVRVVAVSNYGGRNIVEATMEAGAVGYVRKSRAFEDLIPAIRAVVSGQSYTGKGVVD